MKEISVKILQNGESVLDAMIVQAVEANNNADEDQALEKLNTIIRLDNNYLPAYQVRAKIYMSLGWWQLAINDFRVFLRQPDSAHLAEAYYNAGYAFTQLEKFTSAYFYVSKAISLCKDEVCLSVYQRCLATISELNEQRRLRLAVMKAKGLIQPTEQQEQSIQLPNLSKEELKACINRLNPAQLGTHAILRPDVMQNITNLPKVAMQKQAMANAGDAVKPYSYANANYAGFWAPQYYVPAYYYPYPPGYVNQQPVDDRQGEVHVGPSRPAT